MNVKGYVLINFLGICMETSKSNKAVAANPFNIAKCKALNLWVGAHTCMMHAKTKT